LCNHTHRWCKRASGGKLLVERRQASIAYEFLEHKVLEQELHSMVLELVRNHNLERMNLMEYTTRHKPLPRKRT